MTVISKRSYDAKHTFNLFYFFERLERKISTDMVLFIEFILLTLAVFWITYGLALLFYHEHFKSSIGFKVFTLIFKRRQSSRILSWQISVWRIISLFSFGYILACLKRFCNRPDNFVLKIQVVLLIVLIVINLYWKLIEPNSNDDI